MVRKGKYTTTQGGDMSGNYTVMVNGKKYSVQVAEGDADIKITEVAKPSAQESVNSSSSSVPAAGSTQITSQTPGNVWKVLVSVGDKVTEGQKIMILEAMKMEIDVVAPKSGTIASIDVKVDSAVQAGQVLASLA
jgi:pyruvate carboxylase subunit B